jgi:hypothetical protein
LLGRIRLEPPSSPQSGDGKLPHAEQRTALGIIELATTLAGAIRRYRRAIADADLRDRDLAF